MEYAVLGAGRQGLAIAYDLARHGHASAITLVDADRRTLDAAEARLRRLARGLSLRPIHAVLRGLDAAPLLSGHAAAVSALPYRFNAMLAEAAVRARVPFCDLGGNTAVVQETLGLDRDAKSAGVAIVPDCGIAPGLSNVLAALAVEEVEGARHVRIWCGGLPERPRGPLGYSLLFDVAGLTNEYTGEAVVLRKGKVKRVPAFTEHEVFPGPRGLGMLEAFSTSGGSSTAPWTFRGRLETYEYKTVRYFGHYDRMRAIIDLGLLDLEPVEVGGRPVVPRELFHAAAAPRLSDPKVRDFLILRVDCTDRLRRGVRYQLLQRFDRKTGFTAMEQSTGYPAAAVAHALARGEVAPGAVTPERAGLGKEHVAALHERGLAIRRSRLVP